MGCAQMSDIGIPNILGTQVFPGSGKDGSTCKDRFTAAMNLQLNMERLTQQVKEGYLKAT